MPRHLFAPVCASALAVLLVGGCTGGTPVAPTPSGAVTAPSGAPSDGATPASPPAPVYPDGTVVRSVTYLGAQLDVAVEPVQSDGTLAVATIHVTRSDDGNQPVALGQVVRRSTTDPLRVTGLRLWDLAASTVYPQAVDASGAPVATSGPVHVQAGQPTELQAFFAAPQGQAVDVFVSYLGRVEAVPVVVVPALPVTPEALGAQGEVTGAAVPVEGSAESVTKEILTEVSGDDVRLTLPSDVLFEFDSAKLGGKAGGAIDRAGKAIAEQAAEGEVVVIGHTDDQADDAYNLKLSEQRAKAVAARLKKTIGSAFTVRTVGKGETEPVAKGTSEAARAANRRVEIEFNGKSAGKLVVVEEADVELPAQSGPVVAAGQPAAVQVGSAVYQVSVLSMRRSGPYVLAEVEIATDSATPLGMLSLFGEPLKVKERGFDSVAQGTGMPNVSLLVAGKRAALASFVDPAVETRRWMVGESHPQAAIVAGAPVRITLVFPDLGADAVVLDVPDRFRITDIPVTP